MKKLALLALILVTATLTVYSQSCPLGVSGILKIGPSGVYPTLQAALTDLRTKGLSGPLTLELQAAYNSAAETFPLVLDSAIRCGGKGREITIRPEAGAGRLTLSSNAAVTLDLNSGSYYILDGRPGGADTVAAHSLLIDNTNVNGNAVRVVNGARHNQLNHLTIQGVTTNGFTGVVFLAGSTNDTIGNGYNRFDTCTITAGVSTPLTGIFAVSNARSPGNVINGCTIYNFIGNQTFGAYGMKLGAGYDSSIITNNSLYWTADHSPVYGPTTAQLSWTGISVGTWWGGGDMISGNYIGGTAPLASGDPLTVNAGNSFTGISVISGPGKANACQISRNTISNITLSNALGGFTGIDLGTGSFFNGTCNNNVIGNLGGNPNINLVPSTTTPPTGTNVVAINSWSNTVSDPITISTNLVSGIALADKTTGSLWGILANGGNPQKLNILNNTIGNQLYDFNNEGNGNLYGIYITGSGGWQGPDSVTVKGNHIGNMVYGYSGIDNPSMVAGILYRGISNGLSVVDSNTVHDIEVVAGNFSSIYPLAGIDLSAIQPSTGTGTSISCSHNVLYNIGAGSSAVTQADADVMGINLHCGYSPTEYVIHQVTVSGNQIEGLHIENASPAGTYPSHLIAGINISAFGTGSCIVDNNSIQMGLTFGGRTLKGNYNLYGIYDAGTNGKFLHNSVYLHDDMTSPSGPNAACYIKATASTDTTSAVVMNNIFAGYRSALSGPGYSLMQVPYSLSHLTSDYNLFARGGYGGYIGQGWLPSTTKDSTLSAWQQATGLDTHSLTGDSLFVHPEGAWPKVDLHSRFGTPAESKGSAAYTTTMDFDGQLRASYTPVDIGADADNFNGTPPPPPHDTTTHDTTNVPPPVARIDTTKVVLQPHGNPFSTTLTLNVQSPATGTARISIYTPSGTLMIQTWVAVKAGDNTVHIPMDIFPDGTYAVRVDIGSHHDSIQVVKKTG